MGGYRVGYAQGDEFMSILTRLAVMVRSRAVEAYDERGGRSPEGVGGDTKPSAVLSTLTSWPDHSKCARKATEPVLRRSNRGRLRDMGELLGTVRDHPLTISKLLPILQRVEADATCMDGDPDRLRMPRFLSHVFSRMLVGLVYGSHAEDGEIPVRCALNNPLLDKWSDTTLAPFSERLADGSVTMPDGFLDSMLSCRVAEDMEGILSMSHIPVFPDVPLLLAGTDPADSIGELACLERRMRVITDAMNVSKDVEMLPLTMETMRGLVSNPPPMQAWRRAATIMGSRLHGQDDEYSIFRRGFMSDDEDADSVTSRHEHDAEHTFAAMAMSDWMKTPDADAILRLASAFVPKTAGETAEKLRTRMAKRLELHHVASIAYTVDDVALKSGDRDLIPAATMAYVLIRATFDGGVKKATFDEAMVRDLVKSCGGWDLPYGYVSETAAYIVGRRMTGRGAGADPHKAPHSGAVCFNDDRGRSLFIAFDWGITGSGAVDGR